MDEDGGTGSPGSASCGMAAGMEPDCVLYGNLHEYGLSLGVDLEESEDCLEIVQEAWNAPLPASWTEYMDESGRAYYVKEGASSSTWEHPADQIYRTLIDLIRKARMECFARRQEIVQDHLRDRYEAAKLDLAGWSGPYVSDQGEYYYNDSRKVSAWNSPVAEWESELATHHAVLTRYLLLEQAAPSGSEASQTRPDMLQVLRLELGNLRKDMGDVPEPSTCRSYHTARSGTSSRSGRSKHSLGDKERRKDKKNRKDDDEGRDRRPVLGNLPEGNDASSPERCRSSAGSEEARGDPSP
mmetsp:Transcript_28087/g.49879  ORF Transcript_28087/g.49879 Transcript_28087/m.49879 type:complete len:298 (-) Transcript_28087:6-899(-)